jgi:hypothetical protein
MDVIVRVVYQGVTYDLDIDGSIPLRLDVSAVENGDIGNFFGVGSQAFDLAGTKINNKFFKHGYEIGSEDIPAFYNSINGYIIYNGETLLEGQFQLLEILTDESGFITYRCQITDSVVQFKDALASSLVKDADWSAYTHTLSNLNITASWNNDLLSGSVYYPIVDYGRSDNDVYPNIPRLQLGTAAGAIGSPTTPLQAKQFLPAIKLKDTLDVLFDQVGFRYTGSFTETEDFNQMYILNKPNDELGIVVGEGATAIFEAMPGLNQIIAENTEENVFNTIEVFDPQNKYDSNSEYTVSEEGTYTFGGEIGYFNPVYNRFDVSAAVILTLRYGTDNTPGNYVELDYDEERYGAEYEQGLGQFYQTVSFNGTLSAGNKVWMHVEYETVGASAGNLTLQQSSGEFNCTLAPITYNGATVDMGLQWNPTLKSLDFIKGVISQFNLVMTPVYGVNQLIQIEQFDDWIRNGEQKDWTEKYETAKRVGINHTVNEQQRELLLKNVDDNDRFSKLSQENEPNFQYGTLRLLSDNNISQGSKTIADFFGPVVMGGSLIPFETGSDGVTPTFNIDFNTRFVLPHLYKYDNNKQQSFAFKPRLGYKVNTSLPSGSNVNIGTAAEYVSVSGSYGTISNLSSLPAISGSSYDLHFSNDYANFSYTNLGWDVGITSFDRYWKTYLDSLYWEDSRKITLDLEFDSYEYKNIKLNDIIFIKNQRYRINKISGFNLTANDVVTVELIRLYPAYFTGLGTNCEFDFIISDGGITTTTTTSTTSTPTTTSTTTSTTAGPTTTTTTSTTLTPSVYPTSGSLLRVEIPVSGGVNMEANGIEPWYLRPLSAASATPISASLVTVSDSLASFDSNNVAELSSVIITGIPNSSTLGTVAVYYRFAETGSVIPTNVLLPADYIDGRDGQPDPEEGVLQSYIFPRSEEIGTLWSGGDMYSAFDAAPFEKFTPTSTNIFGSSSWEQLPGTRASSGGDITAGFGMDDYKFLAISPTSAGVANGPSSEWRLVLFGSDSATVPGVSYRQWTYGGAPLGSGQNNVRILAMGVWDRVLTDGEVEEAYNYWTNNLR